ncbi:MAG: thiol peroxidase [Polyangiaceae bacterium]
MANITQKGNAIRTSGELPAVGSTAPAFTLVGANLAEVTLANYAGKKKVLNVFPSIDTGVCATSVRTFNKKASGREGVVVLNISKDLPFAMKRFCGAEGLENVEVLSAFRSDFATTYGLQILDGPLQGLCSRCVLVLDEGDKVLYAEQVPDIVQEPGYDQALAALG